MIFREGFHNRIESFIDRALSDFEKSMLSIGLGETDTYKKRLDELNEMKDVHPEQKRWWNIAGTSTPEYHDLSNAKVRLNQEKLYVWLYDKNTQTFICNMGAGYHAAIMAALYMIYKNNKDDYDMDAYADKYVEECMGFYVSGAMGMRIPIKSEQYILNDIETEVFGDIKFRGLS